MSIQRECRYEEWKDGWHLILEDEVMREHYEEYGPFPTLEAAQAHLESLHVANPGGYSILRRDHGVDMDALVEEMRRVAPRDWAVLTIDERMNRIVVANGPELVVDTSWGRRKEKPQRAVYLWPPNQHRRETLPRVSAEVWQQEDNNLVHAFQTVLVRPDGVTTEARNWGQDTVVETSLEGALIRAFAQAMTMPGRLPSRRPTWGRM